MKSEFSIFPAFLQKGKWKYLTVYINRLTVECHRMPDNHAELNNTKDPNKFQVRADLHVHTTYSRDSIITPKDLVYYSKKRGLNAVAVTDHNQLAGAFKIAKETDFLIIPGMGVSSRDGHIVARNVS